MKIETFCCAIVVALLIGNGIVVYFNTNDAIPAFLNLGALVLTIGAGFYFTFNEKTTHSIDAGTASGDTGNSNGIDDIPVDT